MSLVIVSQQLYKILIKLQLNGINPCFILIVRVWAAPPAPQGPIAKGRWPLHVLTVTERRKALEIVVFLLLFNSFR